MSSMTDDLQPLDEQAFAARVEPHRRELHVHCYRLLGSFEEAEDLVQEALLRAWRRRETYEGRASVRAAAAGRARAARRPRLLGEGDRAAARDDRGVGELRAAVRSSPTPLSSR